MPDYLQRVADALCGEEEMSSAGLAAWAQVAQEHALTRVRLGFDVNELIREFVVLRQVLFEFARAEGLSADDDPLSRVVDLIEAAICASVTSYVESRDYCARKQEAEHIGFITHELRNPLASVRLMVDRLREDAVPAQTRTLELIDKNLRRLASLVDSVLVAQRFEAGEVEASLSDVTLDDLLKEPIAFAKAAAQAKYLRFEAAFDPAVVVRADPRLTATALENVLDNAVKYTDRGRIRIEAITGPDEVAVHVWDNCPGLSKEELQTIFDPFKRGHSHKPGTGLGLTLALRAIEAQGGSIHAESPEERGCHFWMTLKKPYH
jgi:signal transduction histidine kinase